MQSATGVIALLFSCAMFGLPACAGDLNWFVWQGDVEVRAGGALDGMSAVRAIPAVRGEEPRLVFGDEEGRLHAVKFSQGQGHEVWISPPLWVNMVRKSPVAGIFVDDVNADGELEIVAYSRAGDFAFYRTSDYHLLWASDESDYETISAMTLANLDEDPQLELVFCGTTKESASRVFVYDCRDFFEEWRVEGDEKAHCVIVADLDGDGNLEVATNTGSVWDARTQRLEWSYPKGFGERIGYFDIDGDGTPELIGEFESLSATRYIRVFNVDQRRETFLTPLMDRKSQ